MTLPPPDTRSPAQPPRAVTARGGRTRERLLDAAERLWSERGVDGVSLREIRLAAGQRNQSALQFHFGDRDGLRLALAQRHLPRLAAIQEDLYLALITQGRQDDLGGLIEVLIRPMAEYLQRGPSERAWTRISAAELGRPEIALQDIADHAPAISRHVGATVFSKLTQNMEPDIAADRLMSVAIACHHLCADRARFDAAPPDAIRRPTLPFERWLANLLDMATAAITAPPRSHSKSNST